MWRHFTQHGMNCLCDMAHKSCVSCTDTSSPYGESSSPYGESSSPYGESSSEYDVMNEQSLRRNGIRRVCVCDIHMECTKIR